MDQNITLNFSSHLVPLFLGSLHYHLLNICHRHLQYHLYSACVSQIVQCCSAVHEVVIKIIQSSLQGFKDRLCFVLVHPLVRMFFPLGSFLFRFSVFSVVSQLGGVF